MGARAVDDWYAVIEEGRLGGLLKQGSQCCLSLSKLV